MGGKAAIRKLQPGAISRFDRRTEDGGREDAVKAWGSGVDDRGLGESGGWTKMSKDDVRVDDE